MCVFCVLCCVYISLIILIIIKLLHISYNYSTNERSDIPDYGILGSDIGSQQNVKSPQNNETRVVGTIESDKHYPNREMNVGQDDYMYMNEFGDDEFQNSGVCMSLLPFSFCLS